MKLYRAINYGMNYGIEEVDFPNAVHDIVKVDNSYYLMCRTGNKILLYESKDEAWDEELRIVNLKIDEYMKLRKQIMMQRNS